VNEIIRFVSSLKENDGKKLYQIHLGYESLQEIKSNYIVRKKPPMNFIETYLLGYEDDSPSSTFLKQKIFADVSSGSVVETYYTKRLAYARNFFALKINEYFLENGLSSIEAIYKKLTHKIVFNVYTIDNLDESYVIFETVNNRGKKLSNLELLKNRMIYLTTLYHENQLESTDREKLRNNINDAWKEVYFQLGRNKNMPLSDDEFLKAHWIVFYQYTRRTGNDYIEFLLSKFSARNVSDLLVQEVLEEKTSGDFGDFDDVVIDDKVKTEKLIVNPEKKLLPEEINEYVNSLKGLAEYWYYSFYPEDCPFLNENERLYIKRLNRIGIGYFRPLVMIALSKYNSEPNEMIDLLHEIERFIFILFRVGGFNASYKSNEFYNYARMLYKNIETMNSITERIILIIGKDVSTAISYFTNRVNRWFEQGNGYYDWYGLKYFLFEYEYMLSEITKLDKVDWSLLSKNEKDKVSIEHILPQTPTKFYWRNQFRHYNEKEIQWLSGSIGNLILLSQSINSSLQNDSFNEKKHPKNSNRRGYYNGSNSEIEVAQELNWDANSIKERGIKYLDFLKDRWNIDLTDKQKNELLALDFVKNERETVAELEDLHAEASKPEFSSYSSTALSFDEIRLNFWKGFVEWCNRNSRYDLTKGRPTSNGWYDVYSDSKKYYLFFQMLKAGVIRLGIYLYSPEIYKEFKLSMETIELKYGSKLEWDTSHINSYEKRILHSVKADVYDESSYLKYYQWFADQYDKMYEALKNIE